MDARPDDGSPARAGRVSSPAAIGVEDGDGARTMSAIASACGEISTRGSFRCGMAIGGLRPTGISPLDRSRRHQTARLHSPTRGRFSAFTSGPVAGGMCVVFLYVRTPKRPGEEAIDCPYAAVVAVNRDESYTRDTARLHWWPQDATADPRECARDWQILAGRDREGGGTWCGVSRDGRVAVLTNVAEASAKFATGEAPSRGELPVAFLEASGHLSNLRLPVESIFHRPPTHPRLNRPTTVPFRRRNTRVDPLRDGSRTSPGRRTRTTASTSSSAIPGPASSLTSPTEATTWGSSPGWTGTARRGARRGSCTDSATPV